MNFIERTKPTTSAKALLTAVPYVIISKIALSKMFHYVQECAEEIGWLGTAIQDGKQIFVEDVYLFDQEVHATTTEITPEGLTTFAEELLQAPDGIEIWNNLKLWGHSHVNMGITPSGQDDKQMETFQQGGHEWFLRLIANKKGELKLDLYHYGQGVIYTDIPWYIEETPEEQEIHRQIFELQQQLESFTNQINVALKEPIVEEMKTKVRKKSYLTNQSYNSNYYLNGKKQESTSTQSSFPNSMKPEIGKGTVEDGTGDKKKVIDFPNKNDDKSDDNNVLGNGTDWHYFETDDAVRQEFSVQELFVLASFDTLLDVQEELDSWGWVTYLTDNDIERIYKVAKKVEYQYGLNQKY